MAAEAHHEVVEGALPLERLHDVRAVPCFNPRHLLPRAGRRRARAQIRYARPRPQEGGAREEVGLEEYPESTAGEHPGSGGPALPGYSEEIWQRKFLHSEETRTSRRDFRETFLVERF